MKRWYAIQTYAGSELKVAELLEERVRQLGLERKVTAWKMNGSEVRFLAPVEEVITSKARRGRTGEYRVPYEYELKIEPNKRIQKGDLIAIKPAKHMGFDAKVKRIETLQRVIVEMSNRNEEEFLIPLEKRIRRDIRTGEKIPPSVPLTTDSDPNFRTPAVKTTVVQRDRIKRVQVEKLDTGETVTLLIPEKYLVRLKEGVTLKKGDLIEKEDKIESRASGLVKIKEYKDKRVVTVQYIEKRRLFPGYIFAHLEMGQDVLQLPEGIKCRFVGNPPLPLSEEDMKVVKRKAGLLEAPKAVGPKIEVEFEVGEVVEIIEGPFADFTGAIVELDKEREIATITVKIFGRETRVDLPFESIQKI
ncbi:MAG: KOW motif-containing protein [Candidatus Bipolaricaulota bacterium]|nr:KOW motif-containing protein [Candidatus Bipolaricaulota bacterium]